MDGSARQHDGATDSVAALLLSHHPPEHAHRTVALGWGARRVRVCARCSGMVIGAAAAMVAVAVAGLGDGFGWSIACFALAAAVPAVVDFHGQLMRRWESTNVRRFVTGAAFGAGMVVSLNHSAAQPWAWAVSVPALLILYFIWVAAGRRRSARLLLHVRKYAAYYDRCRAEDARRYVRTRVGDT